MASPGHDPTRRNQTGLILGSMTKSSLARARPTRPGQPPGGRSQVSSGVNEQPVAPAQGETKGASVPGNAQKAKTWAQRKGPSAAGKQKPPRGLANVAYDHVWSCHREFAIFDSQPECALRDPETAKALVDATKRCGADGACAFYASISHCNSVAKVQAYTKSFPSWGTLDVRTVESTWLKLSRVFQTLIRVYHLDQVADGVWKLAQPQTFNSNRQVQNFWSFLLVPPELNVAHEWHCLPLCNPNRDAELFFEPKEAEDTVGDPPVVQATAEEKGKQVVKPPEVEESSSSSSTAVCITEPPRGPSEQGPAPTLGQIGQEMTILEEEEAFPHLEVLVKAGRLLGSYPLTRILWASICTPELAPICEPPPPEAPIPPRPPRYEGVWAPPDGWEWRGGWWPSTRPPNTDQQGYFRQDPEVVSASLNLACVFADTVLYYPLPPGNSVERVGSRSISDLSGSMVDQHFLPGDVVLVGTTHYRAETVLAYGVPLLKLSVAVEFTPVESVLHDAASFLRNKLCSKVWSWAATPKGQVYPGSAERLTDRTVCQAEWTQWMGNAPPELLPTLTTIRREAQLADWGEAAPRANRAALYAVQQEATLRGRPFGLATGTKLGRGSGTYFAWGDCYSCGGKLPGKRMHGRMCGCVANPTRAARAVREGLHVVPYGGVVYPGVVECTTRHPPLKLGKTTLANPSVFRLCHPDASSLSSNPMRAVARGLEGLV